MRINVYSQELTNEVNVIEKVSNTGLVYTAFRNSINLSLLIPIIIYSTSVNPTDIEETFSLGAILFFRKPNSYEELKRNVSEIFKEKLNSPRSKESYLISTAPSNEFS